MAENLKNQNLEIVYKHCASNLDSVHQSNIHFDFDGENHICSSSLPTPLNFQNCMMPVTDTGILFQVISNISHSDPIIISDQLKGSSFWVECCPDAISRALWSRIPESLESISRASKLPLDFSRLYKYDGRTGSLKLCISWTTTGQDVHVGIHVQDRNGNLVY